MAGVHDLAEILLRQLADQNDRASANMDLKHIRNFCIIAHIDAGKSTLADRFLETTGTVHSREMRAQFLDSLELERERGITIKMAPVRMSYKSSNSEYILNLIDTPGHPDFAYEVSRAFKAVEGAILLVDATQGIQAQTLANFEMAKKSGLKIIGAINKIDLFKGIGGEEDSRLNEMINDTAELIGCLPEEIFRISGKTGDGVDELLKSVINKIPAPAKYDNSRRAALIFDSLYDDHKGIIAYARVFSGTFKAQEETNLISVKEKIKIKEVGYFQPKITVSSAISEGEIGYIATGIKDPDKLKIGDTIGEESIAGYVAPQPRVFVSFFPEQGNEYDDLRKAFQKLKLNDPAIKIESDSSEVLGRGFKAGFLGKLHFEITSQRLEKEWGIRTVNSFPSVAYKIRKIRTANACVKQEAADKKEETSPDFEIIENPEELPQEYAGIWEPMIELEILTPPDYLGNILKLKDVFRMSSVITQNAGKKIILKTLMPLAELISDFDDKIKSATHGFASFSYQMADYQKADLARVDILVANDRVAGLSRVIPREFLEKESRKMVEKLKELLPQQQFPQAVQAVVNSRVIARETIPALKKNVTGHLYGGDRTRKMKLWKKQKEGKKKLLGLAKVEISADVFKELLKK